MKDNLKEDLNNQNNNLEDNQTKEESNQQKEIEDNFNENQKSNDKNLEEMDQLKEDTTRGLSGYINENAGETFLSKNDFISPSYPEKKNFCETRYFRRIVLIILYIIIYTINAIYIRINSLNLIPIKASFIQGSLFSIFIPISFLVASNKNFKKKRRHIGKEKEVLNIEIENNMKDNLSDFMNKRFYEVYYQYVSKFYLLTAFFSVLYFLSIYLFYQGISFTQPLFGQIFFSFISAGLILIKLFDKKMKCNLNKILSYICILGSSIVYMISFLKNDDIKFDKNYAFSTLFLVIFVVCQSTLIYFVKKVFKKYFYYVDVLEFVGYIGIYIVVFVPFILTILYFIFYSELIYDNPSGNSMFIVIGKGFFSTCICDLCLAYILKYFALKITCKLMIINLSIIYLIFYIVTGKEKIFKDYYFMIGQVLTVILFILLIQNIYKKNLKREEFEVKKQRLRAGL